MEWRMGTAFTVSIRAPVVRPERLVTEKNELDEKRVSIRAPVVRPERPPHSSAHQSLCWCFNPRSGCETGATHAERNAATVHPVSIRAPVVRPERQPIDESTPTNTGFQSALRL